MWDKDRDVKTASLPKGTLDVKIEALGHMITAAKTANTKAQTALQNLGSDANERKRTRAEGDAEMASKKEVMLTTLSMKLADFVRKREKKLQDKKKQQDIKLEKSSNDDKD